MAYYNNASSHSTSSAVRESDPSPFLGRQSASSTKEYTSSTLHELVERSPARTFSRPTAAHHPDSWNQDGSFIPTLALELPSLSRFMLKGPITPSPRGVSTFYQPSASPDRIEAVQPGQFQPYGADGTGPDGYGNAEAGPSTLGLPHAPHVTEEGTAPASKLASPPRRSGGSHRKRKQENEHKLCKRVQQRTGAIKAPFLNRALAVAVEIVSKTRPVIYNEPRLLKYPSRNTITSEAEGQPSATAMGKVMRPKERNDEKRKLYEELSKYFRVERENPWTVPSLLLRVIKELEDTTPETPR